MTGLVRSDKDTVIRESLLVKNTVPNTNTIGVYLDCEKDAIKTERVWTKLVGKVETALGRGEEVILI